MRDKWEKNMVVAEMAAGPCFAPAEGRFNPRERDLETSSKICRLKKWDFFLHCLTEPLGFASRAACCDPKGQKSLFLFYTAPEVSSVSRTCGFRMTLSHWGQAGSHCCSSPAVPWYRWIKPEQRGNGTGAGRRDSLVTVEGALGFFKSQEHLY